ncbi:hypothetical protein C8C85_2858 [Flavobacterium sp. 103]|nr:hypothetical protein C8C85_2858 [Flavobacterium sp. 103]
MNPTNFYSLLGFLFLAFLALTLNEINPKSLYLYQFKYKKWN